MAEEVAGHTSPRWCVSNEWQRVSTEANGLATKLRLEFLWIVLNHRLEQRLSGCKMTARPPPRVW